MRRRDFIKVVGGVAVTWPVAARAQRGERMRRIGVLIGVEDDVEDKRASRHSAKGCSIRAGVKDAIYKWTFALPQVTLIGLEFTPPN